MPDAAQEENLPNREAVRREKRKEAQRNELRRRLKQARPWVGIFVIGIAGLIFSLCIAGRPTAAEEMVKVSAQAAQQNESPLSPDCPDNERGIQSPANPSTTFDVLSCHFTRKTPGVVFSDFCSVTWFPLVAIGLLGAMSAWPRSLVYGKFSLGVVGFIALAAVLIEAAQPGSDKIIAIPGLGPSGGILTTVSESSGWADYIYLQGIGVLSYWIVEAIKAWRPTKMVS